MLPGGAPKQGVGVGHTARELREEVGQDTQFGAIYQEMLVEDGRLRNQPRKGTGKQREQRKIKVGMKRKEEPEDTGGRGAWGSGESRTPIETWKSVQERTQGQEAEGGRRTSGFGS